MKPVVIVRRIRKPLKEAQLKQIVNAWNRMIDAKAGNPWWKKISCEEKASENLIYIKGKSKLLFFVFDENKKPIGDIQGRILAGKYVEMGYWLDPKKFGKGYMAEALKKVLRYLKQKGFKKALFATPKKNIKSRALLLRIGAKQAGTETRKRMGKRWLYRKYEVLLK